MKEKVKTVAAGAQVSFSRSEILALCTTNGPQLHIDPSQAGTLEGRYVMAAIAANESSLGANCTPRHEPAWDTGGVYAANPEQQNLLREYGSAAACSYGPWQIMFYNCPGYTPEELQTDADAGARCFLNYFNTYVQKKGAITLEQIGQTYNSGHIWEIDVPVGVQAYVERLQTNYQMVQSLF